MAVNLKNYGRNYKKLIVNAYERLKELYLSGKIHDSLYMYQHNPIKNSFELGEHNEECITAFTNVMTAKSENGVLTKVISYDDLTGKKAECVHYVSNEMRTQTMHNQGLTTLRCALMSMLTTDLCYPIKQDTKIGFIGNGNINLTTLEVITMFKGIHEVVIRGSSRDRRKNEDLFIEANNGKSVIVDDTEDLRLINECDIIFCCTTSTGKENMISFEQLSHPMLFVVSDSGYVLDESFRKHITKFYTDYDKQLEMHFIDEFPYDNDMKTLSRIETMKEDITDRQKAVYLYGIALADIIVFEEVFLRN